MRKKNSISHCTHLPAQLRSGNDLRMLSLTFSYLKAEELPELLRPKLTEIQEELGYVSGIAWHVSASAAIAKMSDEQVSQLARRVHDLHDALMNFSRPYPTSASDIK